MCRDSCTLPFPSRLPSFAHPFLATCRTPEFPWRRRSGTLRLSWPGGRGFESAGLANPPGVARLPGERRGAATGIGLKCGSPGGRAFRAPDPRLQLGTGTYDSSAPPVTWTT
ncbi:hypothetical protein NN561_003342 [Cricetulus griseus]